MYYQQLSEAELGFDAFIAPDGFNHEDLSGDHPVDIYAVFKREYALNSHARYIYYYSPGNYPLTLTPTATEYYRYGYTNALNQEVIVDVPLNGSPVTIWGNNITTPLNTSGGDESGYTKRWVVVCRPSTAKFDVFTTDISSYIIWVYASTYINTVGLHSNQTANYTTLTNLKYIHYANINSLTQLNGGYTYWSSNAKLTGTLTIPETVNVISYASLYSLGSVSKVYLPNTKSITNNSPGYVQGINTGVNTISLGACTSLEDETTRNKYTNLAVLSVSPQNTAYSSFNNCDIIYTKALTAIVWIAPKTVRGLYIPDELPQSEIGTTGTGITTKLSTNIMQGYPLHIGSLITELTNLYLSNKSFTTITVGAGNTAFTVENNILFNADKTTLVKAGSASPGNITIPTTVTSVSPAAFLRYSHTGSIPLIFSGAGQFNLSNYSDFTFATFTGQSLSDIIANNKLVNGTVGSPKYFYINQASLDALNAYNSNAVNIAETQQYINIVTFPQGAVLHLDASNAASYPGSGTTWYDLSGNGNNGTLVGTTYSNGVMNFDGNDYVNLGTGATLKCTTNRFTLSAWIYPTANPNAGNGAGIISFGKTTDNNGHEIITAMIGGVQKFYTRGKGLNVEMASNSSINLNQWVHVISVWDGSKIKLYVNGVLDVESVCSGTVATDNNANLMGTRTISIPTASSYFTGKGNDYMKFNKDISSSEVAAIYNIQKSKYGL